MSSTADCCCWLERRANVAFILIAVQILFVNSLPSAVSSSPATAAATPSAATDFTEADIGHLTEIVERIMECYHIPSLAISVVDATAENGGRVLLERGYGVVNMTSRAPVNSDTLFALGSATKAFTTSLMAILINKHANLPTRFNWTTPVTQLLRGQPFALYNDQLTSQATLEDILSHRTGIPDYFLLLVAGYPYHMTRRQLVQSLRYHKPRYAFRSEYAYNNHMYVLAGYVAEVLEAKSWEELISAYLLKPLNMTSTTFVDDVLAKSPNNMAAPCAWANDSCQPVDLQLLDQVNVAGPAGAIVSTARDMSRWMLFHLNGGKVKTESGTTWRTLIDKYSLWDTYRERNMAFGRHMTLRNDPNHQRHQQHSSSSQAEQQQQQQQQQPRQLQQHSANHVTDVHTAYDLGWMTSYYRGFRRIWHSGSISTYKTQVWLYPDVGYGLFVSVGGPHRHDTTAALTNLLHAISDILLRRPAAQLHLPQQQQQQQPPETSNDRMLPPPPSTMAVETLVTCSSNAQPSPVMSTISAASEAATISPPPSASTVDHIRNALPAYADQVEGVYVSVEFGINVTVSWSDDVNSGRRLRLSVGRMLTAELQRYDVAEDEFYAIAGGKLWWFADVLDLPVRFIHETSRDSRRRLTVKAVEIPLQSASPTVAMTSLERARFRRVGVQSTSGRLSRVSITMTTMLCSMNWLVTRLSYDV